MSPEQVKGRQIDGRADIFSLGVILYELVTGEKPFGGQNITTVIYKIVNQDPIPPRELDASVPLGLNYVISKALAKNVEERYQTCRELADDLKNYRNLGVAPVGQGTLIMGAKTVAAPAPVPEPPPPPPVPEEPPVLSPAEAIGDASIDSVFAPEDVPPEPEIARPSAIPQIAWVLGAFVVLGVMGLLSYLFVLRPQTSRLPPAPAARVTPSPQAPVTPAPQPAKVAPAAVVATTPAAEVKPVSAPVVTKTAVAPAPAAKLAEATPQPARARTPVAKVGQLMVASNVNGAKISVDGRSEANWVTPFTIADLPAGAHNVVISMDGYEDFQQSVTIDPGQTGNVTATLSSPRAELNIVTEPAAVEVLIDGKSYGPSPVRVTLAIGSHTYVVKPPGMAPYQSSVTLKSGQIITKKLSLSAAVSTGIVEVRTSPPGASVLADGSPVGSQTPTSFRLTVGSHKLVIAMPGHASSERQVTVAENSTVAVTVDLGQ
jgi:serine/threonine-protein kinase